MFNKNKVTGFLLLLLGINLVATSQPTKKIDASAFIRRMDSIQINTMTAIDSQEVKQFYNGDFNKLRNMRRTSYIPATQKVVTWRALQKYLLMDSAAIRQKAIKMGLDSAYYFLKFLRSKSSLHIIKTNIINYLKDTAYKKYKDDIVFHISDNDLITFVQYKETEKQRGKHKGMPKPVFTDQRLLKEQ